MRFDRNRMTTSVCPVRDPENQNGAAKMVKPVNSFAASHDVSEDRFGFLTVRAVHSSQVGNTKNANHITFSDRGTVDVPDARRFLHLGN